MSISLKSLFEKMWDRYIITNPLAEDIYKVFQNIGESPVNDHIALRTWNHPKVNLEKIASIFEALGYEAKGEYHFAEKKLRAKHYELTDHSSQQDILAPKIFISELLLEEFNQEVQEVINGLLISVTDQMINDPLLCTRGRLWDCSYETYMQLKKYSDYAAWVAAFGYVPNHFTISINHLTSFENIEELNQMIKKHGFVMNQSGGEVKGSPEVLLEQSSTLATVADVHFSDGVYQIPSTYYEFAKRYPTQDGKLYQGFITQNANYIFESTSGS